MSQLNTLINCYTSLLLSSANESVSKSAAKTGNLGHSGHDNHPFFAEKIAAPSDDAIIFEDYSL